MYINKALIYGNLTRDPELRKTNSGIDVAAIGVATNRVYNDKDGNKQEEVEFHNVTLFGKQAELVAQYLKKGSPIYIEGRLRTSSWEADGVKKYKTEIISENFQFGPKNSGSSDNKSNDAGGSQEVNYPKSSASNEIDPNDIPF